MYIVSLRDGYLEFGSWSDREQTDIDVEVSVERTYRYDPRTQNKGE
jgi:hypothetical protein